MKSITLKEIANQLNHPEFSHALVITEIPNSIEKSEPSDFSILDEDKLEFYFDSQEMLIFKKETASAKTDGKSIFIVDTDGNQHEIQLFKTVRMEF